jgi:uncharacterized protein (DUF1697 family)
MSRFVALLRGINVGGRNKIPMAELADCVRLGGYEDVSTYIQSGNVLFSASGEPRTVESDLSRLIHERFAFEIPVVVRSDAEMAAVVAEAPTHYGDADHRCDVIFLKHPLAAAEAMAAMPPPKEGVDRFAVGPGAVYASRLTARATSSRIGRITASPIYPNVTIRNWNTTRKLHQLLST